MTPLAPAAESQGTTNPFTLRAPSTLSFPEPSNTTSTSKQFDPPPIAFLTKTPWHITHSTLPMWKSKRNVKITYTALPSCDHSSNKSNGAGSSAANSPKIDTETDRIDDLVTYQTLSSDHVKSVHGIDKASTSVSGAWDWRGKGWLMIASSHWEILGWGHHNADTGDEEDWMVTYFAKTLFTPAGVDVYSRRGFLSGHCLKGIQESLSELGDRLRDEEFRKLAAGLFEIRQSQNAWKRGRDTKKKPHIYGHFEDRCVKIRGINQP